jgi:hypothetical protein
MAVLPPLRALPFNATTLICVSFMSPTPLIGQPALQLKSRDSQLLIVHLCRITPMFSASQHKHNRLRLPEIISILPRKKFPLFRS